MSKAKQVLAALSRPFRSGNGLDVRLILALAAINGLVLVNAILHDPRVGYDALEHLKYIEALSQLRLVTPGDSHEFFSPPLPYVFPALLINITGMQITWAAKLAQYLNVLLSVGSTLFLIQTCRLVSPRSSLGLRALLFLGILPVYYKTFAFVRGEPYVVFFAAVILHYTLRMLLGRQFTTANAVILGTAMGLCALSRQWGILLFPSVFFLLALQWIRLRPLRFSIGRVICVCLVLTAALSGWFYLSLNARYGSGTAFNRARAARFSLDNQPSEFYFGLSPRLLFSKPTRPSFPNQFVPIFYSEVWGDYWCYFTVYGRVIITSESTEGAALEQALSTGSQPDWLETNYGTASAYLGRVNLIGILPSVLALVSLVAAAMSALRSHGDDPLAARQRVVLALSVLAIGMTMAGYFLFLIMYPSIGKGDTIKATYVLQIAPFLAILVGVFLGSVERRSRAAYCLLLGALCLVFFHNLPAMLTHYRLGI